MSFVTNRLLLAVILFVITSPLALTIEAVMSPTMTSGVPVKPVALPINDAAVEVPVDTIFPPTVKLSVISASSL